MNNNKCFGYIRVSGKGQARSDKDGYKRQLQAIEQFSKNNNYELEKVFFDCVSGTKNLTERKEFSMMLIEILKNGVNTILIEGLDRLARASLIQENIIIYLASKAINLIDCRTCLNITDSVRADPMKKALIQIQGVFSELEKSLLVKKLRLARERIKERTGKCEGRKSLKEVKPEVLDLIKSLRRKRQGKRLSCKAIAEKLNEQGLTTVSGQTFTGFNIYFILKRLT